METINLVKLNCDSCKTKKDCNTFFKKIKNANFNMINGIDENGSIKVKVVNHARFTIVYKEGRGNDIKTVYEKNELNGMEYTLNSTCMV